MNSDARQIEKNLRERCARPLVRRSLVAYGEMANWGPIEDWSLDQLYQAWVVVYEIHNVVRDELDSFDCCPGCSALKPCQICTLHERLKA